MDCHGQPQHRTLSAHCDLAAKRPGSRCRGRILWRRQLLGECRTVPAFNANAEPNAITNSYRDSDVYTYADPNCYVYTYGYVYCDRHVHTYCNRDVYADLNGYSYRHVYADGDCDSHSNGYFDTHSDSNSDINCYCYCYCNVYAHTNSYSSGYRHANGYTDSQPLVMTAVGPANVWIGLKNSDDVGTRFDLLAEVLKNGTVIGSGQVNSVSGGSSGFNNAILDTY